MKGKSKIQRELTVRERAPRNLTKMAHRRRIARKRMKHKSREFQQ